MLSSAWYRGVGGSAHFPWPPCPKFARQTQLNSFELLASDFRTIYNRVGDWQLDYLTPSITGNPSKTTDTM